jgi:hypothetical protein
MPDYVRKDLTFLYVEDVEQVFAQALAPIEGSAHHARGAGEPGGLARGRSAKARKPARVAVIQARGRS